MPGRKRLYRDVYIGERKGLLGRGGRFSRIMLVVFIIVQLDILVGEELVVFEQLYISFMTCLFSGDLRVDGMRYFLTLFLVQLLNWDGGDGATNVRTIADLKEFKVRVDDGITKNPVLKKVH